MPLRRFQEDRRDRWLRLGSLLDRVGSDGLDILTTSEAEELHSLYRLAAGDLNFVQTRTGNPTLRDYLEHLVARAHVALSAPRPGRFWPAWRRIVRHDFPAAVRAHALAIAGAALLLLAGTAFGAILTLVAPDTAATFLGGAFPEHLGSPAERVKHDTSGDDSQPTAVERLSFALYLFANNSRVAAFAFALGFTFGIGTAVVLFFNGVILGCVAARYCADGFAVFLMAWIGPHGAVELPCIVLAGGAGLLLGRALWRGRGALSERLTAEMPQAVALLVGTASWLVVAGLIEAGFSQLHPPTVDYWIKIAFSAVLFAGFMYYLFRMPIGKNAELVTK